jgi:hypothetical protein
LLEKKTYQDFNGEKPNTKESNQIAGSPKKITKAYIKLNKKNGKVK